MLPTTHHKLLWSVVLILLVVIAVLLALGMQERATLRTTLEATRADLASTTAAYEAHSTLVRERLGALAQNDLDLADQLYNEQKRINEVVEDFDRDVNKLSGSVKNLEKLTTTDPELLQKYSKVYFLNEHYVPEDLTTIDEKFDYENGKEVTVHSKVWPYLDRLLEAAWDDGIELKVLSGFRSFEEQSSLKSQYKVQYGVGANQFSADQGYSEHQLGTTIDFTTDEVGASLDGFGDTEAFAWLENQAYRYGFVLSYPEDNDYYIYEPWHWRFVGTDLARYLNRENAYFYDLEQREIDTYLASLFD